MNIYSNKQGRRMRTAVGSSPRRLRRLTSRMTTTLLPQPLLLLVVFFVFLVSPIESAPSKPTRLASPTSSPVSSLESKYLSKFASAIGNQLVYQQGTAQRMAALWMIRTDPLKLPITSNHLIQRFLLVLFYYQMSNKGKSPWTSCNPPNAAKRENATCFYYQDATLIANDAPFLKPPYYRWLSAKHECSWVGIVCKSSVVQVIQLFNQSLSGTLSTEIVKLPQLVSFSVPFNNIVGTIPAVLPGLARLVNVELHFNLLSGSFSNKWYQSTNLQVLNLGANQIGGTLIASQLGKLSKLKGLHLFQNQMSGTIPTHIGLLTALSYLRLHANIFSGTLPSTFGRLSFLKELRLELNAFSGTIPSQFGLMKNVTDLRMKDNLLLGTIPEQLYSMTNLVTALLLEGNRLIGTVSTRIGRLKNLQVLTLSRNRLTGTIPTQLALLTHLQLAWLHLNQFQGSVPTQICKNRGLAVDLKLEFLEADCGPASKPAQKCSCCTACCDRATSICVRVNN